MDRSTASALLSEKLNPSAIRQRKLSGVFVDYVEGWFAIAEANRIFGHFDWTRETIEMRMVAEAKRKIGKEQQVDGWGVTYIARVRVTVDGVIRDGMGAGHGVDRDLGQAHESAAKEAETDAMKRALMTFGYPLGLALYDKNREHVGITPPAFDANAAADRIERMLKKRESLDDLRDAWQAEREALSLIEDRAPDRYAAIVALKDEIKAKFAAVEMRQGAG